LSSLPAAVLWDLDGTLIDTEPYWIRCEKELVASFGGQWTDADATSIVGSDLLAAAEIIRARGGVTLRPQEIVEHLVDGVIAQLRQNLPWRPGARELLASLRLRGVPCALVTMSWKRLTDEVLPHLPPGSFQAVITGDMVMNGKPHPEPYRRAAEELRVDPLSCVAIEDSPTGVKSAEAAGCVVVAVQHLVPIPSAPHRVMLTSLKGITPEHLGEWVETTPLPDHPAALEHRGPEPERPPERVAAALRFSPLKALGVRGLGALLSDRGRVLGVLAAVLLLVVGGVWFFAIRETKPKYEPGAFNVHAWAPDWELDQSLPKLPDKANLFHQISPFWFRSTGVTLITVSDRVDTEDEVEATDDFIAEARNRSIPIVPSITDGTAPGAMAAILADPTERAAHVDAIATFAADEDFAGIDINYENFAFADDRGSWATTRPNWVAFITELGTRLHADGRMLTVSVPPVYDAGRTDDSGYWVYDYGGIAPHVDAIRMMTYDYSTATPGPIAPLDWVGESIDGAIEAAGGPEKLMLGIPLYGKNWIISTDGECPASAPEFEGVQLDGVADLVTRRSATPTFDPVTGESSFTYQVTFTEGDQSCIQTRQVNYMDAQGARLRMQLSIDRGLLGVALFAFGYDDEAVWADVAKINESLETTIPDGETAPSSTVATTTTPVTTVAAVTEAPTTTVAATTATTPATTVPG